jgi:hypothetical protein
MMPFNFENPDGEEELKKWLREHIPQFVTMSDQMHKLLADSKNPNSEQKYDSVIDVAASFVKSGGSCYEKANLTDEQIQMFEKLLPALATMATIAVKGPLVPIQSQENKTYSKTETAHKLGISISSLERKMKFRQIEYSKHGDGKSAKVTFTQAAMDAFRQKNTRGAKEKRRKVF